MLVLNQESGINDRHVDATSRDTACHKIVGIDQRGSVDIIERGGGGFGGRVGGCVRGGVSATAGGHGHLVVRRHGHILRRRPDFLYLSLREEGLDAVNDFEFCPDLAIRRRHNPGRVGRRCGLNDVAGCWLDLLPMRQERCKERRRDHRRYCYQFECGVHSVFQKSPVYRSMLQGVGQLWCFGLDALCFKVLRRHTRDIPVFSVDFWCGKPTAPQKKRCETRKKRSLNRWSGHAGSTVCHTSDQAGDLSRRRPQVFDDFEHPWILGICDDGSALLPVARFILLCVVAALFTFDERHEQRFDFTADLPRR